MSTRVRLLFICISIAIVVVAVPLTSYYFDTAAVPHAICHASCERIRRGKTTESEVEAIFGVPPGDYTTRPDVPMPDNFWQGQTRLKWRTWYADRAGVAIGFDGEGKVQSFAGGYSDKPALGLEYKIRRLFGQVQATRRVSIPAK